MDKSNKYDGICEECGCGKVCLKTRNNIFEKILCSKCCRLLRKKGKYRKTKNEIRTNDKYSEVIFYDKDGFEVGKVKIDTEDIERVGKFRWNLEYKKNKKKSYALCKNRKSGELYLHRFIKSKKGFLVDHINGDIFDNRKSNLRNVTEKQNSWNAKKRYVSVDGVNVVGVRKYKTKNKGYRYRSSITIDGKQFNLGIYETLEKAVEVRTKKELEIRGEFSPYICRV